MTWDPSGLEIYDVLPDRPVPSQEPNISLTVNGTGFSQQMFGLFVLSGQAPVRNNLIPCNDIKVVHGNDQLTLRICPVKKALGSYDLIMWCAPPASVTDPNGNEAKGIPTNDVFVLKNAITVA
jgi:hypothetical protein